VHRGNLPLLYNIVGSKRGWWRPLYEASKMLSSGQNGQHLRYREGCDLVSMLQNHKWLGTFAWPTGCAGLWPDGK